MLTSPSTWAPMQEFLRVGAVSQICYSTLQLPHTTVYWGPPATVDNHLVPTLVLGLLSKKARAGPSTLGGVKSGVSGSSSPFPIDERERPQG